MELKSKQKIYLNLIIFGLLFCLVLILIILPLINRLESSSQGFQENQRTLLILKEKKNYLDQLEKEAQISQTNLEQVQEFFLQPDQAINFIKTLENIASLTVNQQGIKIIAPTKAKREEKKEEKPTLSFQLSLWGSFPNLIRYLIYLENMDYCLQVEELRIRRLPEREMSGRPNLSVGDIETTVNIVVYTQEL